MTFPRDISDLIHYIVPVFLKFCSDAPAVSTGQENAMANLSVEHSVSQNGAPESDRQASSGEQWDDEALAATFNRKASAHATGNVVDMKALDTNRSENDNIAKKLHIEENKAKLAAAKQGMEREAQRIKEEQEKKKETSAAASSRFGAAANTAAASGGKWVPPHMRAGALPKIRMTAAAGGGGPQKVDTQNEELFPDLSKADEIIEQQQKQQQPVFKAKKTPVGGGATWASKSKVNKPELPKEETKPEEPFVSAAAATEATTEKETPAPPATETATAAKAAAKPLVKKKKKKDLSTFKS